MASEGHSTTILESRVLDDPPSEAVVRAVASVSGEDPCGMAPLYAAVDPDALDALYSGTGSNHDRAAVTVEFSYNGYRVRLTGDGTLTVSDPA